MGKQRFKKMIGRREKVDFPELDLFGIDAKVDTGAYTSAIHCHDIVTLNKNGDDFVRFKLLDPDHASYNHKQFELPVFKIKSVKSSSGQSEKRCIIKTKIQMVEEPFEIELSLTDRSAMEYPVLIGRKVLRGRFIVDVAQLNLIYRSKNIKT